jgi:hypothetical protein
MNGKQVSNSFLHNMFRKKKYLFFLLYLAVFFNPGEVSAQEIAGNTVCHFLARVTGRTDHEPVQFAHIINITTGHGNISDTLGFFTILVQSSDLISISAIGYYNYTFQITDSLLTSGRIPNIELISRSYPIDQVSVNPLGSYEQFKSRVLALELPEPKTKINPLFLKDLRAAADTLDVIGPPSLGSPVTAIYNLVSKEGKSKRKLAEIMKQEELERILYPKYNRELVAHISGLEGIELNEFMRFCNFDPVFLLEANDYQIAETILLRLKEWKKIKHQEAETAAGRKGKRGSEKMKTDLE